MKVILSELDKLPLEEIKGFVTAVHNSQWWVACALCAYEDSREIKINFRCPQGPSPSFKYPSKQNVLVISQNDVVTKVDSRTVTGRTYTVTKQESKAATNKLKVWKKLNVIN